MPKISVIVPVYNAEKYLHRCIDSILAQTFTDFELLLIDDGSKDHSGSICDEYAKKDSRVRVFHKENGGVSSARNTGIAESKGEWITFVDADDWVDETFLEEMMAYATEQNAEIVTSDFRFICKGHNVDHKKSNWAIDKVRFLKNYIASTWTIVWGGLYNKNIFLQNHITFPEGITYCEDFYVAVRLCYFSRKTLHLPKVFYNYNYTNEESTMHKLGDKQTEDEKWCYLETIDFFRKEHCLKEYEKEMSWRILKNKQDLVLDKNRHQEFICIYPTSHKYIWSCPFCNNKIKIMMWCLTHHLQIVTYAICIVRYIMGR